MKPNYFLYRKQFCLVIRQVFVNTLILARRQNGLWLWSHRNLLSCYILVKFLCGINCCESCRFLFPLWQPLHWGRGRNRLGYRIMSQFGYTSRVWGFQYRQYFSLVWFYSVFVTASHQTGLDTRSMTRSSVYCGVKRTGTNLADLC